MIRLAADFLNPELFKTAFDAATIADKQYETGLATGREVRSNGGQVTIGQNDVWGAHHGNTSISSYEKLGYHANTADLLRGFLDSGVEIIVYRVDGRYRLNRESESADKLKS
jgi:hypothetical protein